jgi:hypothetical protein
LRAIGNCSSFAGGASPNFKKAYFFLRIFKINLQSAAMWDSQNGFAEKCAVA